MLDEQKQLYAAYADEILPGWRNESKNDLCRSYVKYSQDEQLSQAYFSAIMCKYWPLISKFYSNSYNVAFPEDVYDWLLTSVQYALKYHSWDRPDSSIYQDPNGPDKVINRCMKCRRLTYYQGINRKKRKDGNLMLSLNQIIEDLNDCNDTIEDLSQRDTQDDVILFDYLKKLCNEQKRFDEVLVMDLIINDNVFSFISASGQSTYKFNLKKFKNCLHAINDNYLKVFANRYGCDLNWVMESWDNLYTRLMRDETTTLQHIFLNISQNSDFFTPKVSSKESCEFILDLFSSDKDKSKILNWWDE